MDTIDYLFCYVFDYSTDTIHKLMLQESAKTPKDFGCAEELISYWGFNPDECSWMFSNEDLTIYDMYKPYK